MLLLLLLLLLLHFVDFYGVLSRSLTRMASPVRWNKQNNQSNTPSNRSYSTRSLQTEGKLASDEDRIIFFLRTPLHLQRNALSSNPSFNALSSNPSFNAHSVDKHPIEVVLYELLQQCHTRRIAFCRPSIHLSKYFYFTTITVIRLL